MNKQMFRICRHSEFLISLSPGLHCSEVPFRSFEFDVQSWQGFMKWTVLRHCANKEFLHANFVVGKMPNDYSVIIYLGRLKMIHDWLHLDNDWPNSHQDRNRLYIYPLYELVSCSSFESITAKLQDNIHVVEASESDWARLHVSLHRSQVERLLQEQKEQHNNCFIPSLSLS